MKINITSKNQVLELIEKERLIGVMNNTKWNALFSDLNKVDELISYRVTYIDGTTWPDKDSSFSFTSELAQIWGNFIAMEYLDIDARISHSRGALLEPDIIDYTSKIIDICSNHSVKMSLSNNWVRVWGYFRQGDEPELYKHITLA